MQLLFRPRALVALVLTAVFWATMGAPIAGAQDADPAPNLIGVAHSVTIDRESSSDQILVTYNFVVENFGDTELRDVQVYDDLTDTFGRVPVEVAEVNSDPACPESVAVINTSVGEVLSVLAPGCVLQPHQAIHTELALLLPADSSGVFFSSAVAAAHTVDGIEITDLSSSGSRPDANNNGDPSDDTTPTVIDLTSAPAASLMGTSMDRESVQAMGDAGSLTPSPEPSRAVQVLLYALIALLILGAFLGGWLVNARRRPS